ncbi:MAG: hypothetical protein SXG53_21560 [Pseudomonadota bacterium]|nr:hypothetical protein [Pseudomonadota bacterium]
MLCDVTLAEPDADFMDPHFWLGSPPGDMSQQMLANVASKSRGISSARGGDSPLTGGRAAAHGYEYAYAYVYE